MYDKVNTAANSLDRSQQYYHGNEVGTAADLRAVR